MFFFFKFKEMSFMSDFLLPFFFGGGEMEMV